MNIYKKREGETICKVDKRVCVWMLVSVDWVLLSLVKLLPVTRTNVPDFNSLYRHRGPTS